jgi:CubicO group peptidase (beta-lactamase class C family)
MAAGVVRGDVLAVSAVTGVRMRGMATPAASTDRWHIGSNTKPMTALLMARLIELGLLDWETPMEQIFPEHARGWDAELKRITPAMLVTHNSGLPHNWPGGWFAVPQNGSPALQRTWVLQNLGSVKREGTPGQKFIYSNLGYTVAGAIIDRRGKGTWEKQLQTRIFQPLKIASGGLGPPGKPGALLQPWPHKDSGVPVRGNEVLDNPPVMSSAGRVHMSIPDYARFLSETLRLTRGQKGLVSPAMAGKLFTNPLPQGNHSLSGWVGVRKEPAQKGITFEHNGTNNMHYCTAVLVPDQNMAVCVFTNQGGDAAREACHEVRKKVLAGESR